MIKLTRRAVVAGGIASVGAPFINSGSYRLSAAEPKRYSGRAIDLVRGSIVLDMLAPIKIESGPEFYTKPLSDGMAAEFRASGINGIHHSFGFNGPNARDQALSYFAIWGNYVARNSHVVTGVDKAADIVRAKRGGTCAVIMGLQNADHLLEPADVKTFYDLGQRCAQLTYNSQNLIGSGSTERVDGGVSDFGVNIIKAMNKAGMLIDVSHSGPRTTLDAIDVSPKPIAITHSNCGALLDHPRNKSDAAICALPAKGGVMGITGVRNFVSAIDPTTIVNIGERIDHVAKLVCIEHVGIGSDADLNGYDDMSPEANKALRAVYKSSYAFRDKIDVDGFDHPRKMYDLAEELIRRRYSDANIQAVLGGNFMRLLGATWGG